MLFALIIVIQDAEISESKVLKTSELGSFLTRQSAGPAVLINEGS